MQIPRGEFCGDGEMGSRDGPSLTSPRPVDISRDSEREREGLSLHARGSVWVISLEYDIRRR